MTKAGTRIAKLAREQMDRRLDQIRSSASLLEPPREGWVRSIRRAFGMTQAHVAARMGVSRQAVSQLEAREADGSVTLKAMEQVAEAFGGRLVYAIVPERPICETLEQRAARMAARMMGSVRHSMKLEDQEPLSSLDEPTRELAKELISSPRRLWSDIDGQ